jgi:hypothetical protein
LGWSDEWEAVVPDVFFVEEGEISFDGKLAVSMWRIGGKGFHSIRLELLR